LSSATGRVPFVGRQQDLARLLGCLDTAAHGDGRLMLVAGEPGIGKTRLLDEFAQRAKAEGWAVLAGQPYDSEGMPPYLPFSEALRDYVRAVPLNDLRAQLDEAGPEVALLAPDILRRLPELVLPLSRAADEQRYRLFESVAGFLLAIPVQSEARGLVLILDDLHWAEPSTVLLLQHLARRLRGVPLLLLGAYRGEEIGRGHSLTALLAEQRRSDNGLRLQLSPLAADEIGALVREMAGGEPAAAVVAAIARQTEGNPFFVGEVVRDLMAESRDLTLAETAIAAVAVPAGVREVIEHRLERLGAPASGLMPVAAVLGDGFDFEALRAATGGAIADILDALDEAVAAGMLREEGGSYHFSHALIRQTLCDGLSLARRRLLHQQVARSLERQYAERAGEHAPQLAEHFASCTDPSDLARAVTYAELAAAHAMDAYAYGEAVRHLNQAVLVQAELDPQDRAKRCDLLLALGEALLPAGEPLRTAEVIAPEALVQAEALVDPERASRACLLALEGLMRYGQMAMWSTPAWQLWAERADRYAAPGTVERARADRFLAQLRIQKGQTEAGLLLLRRALTLARELDDPQTFLRVAQSLLTWGRPEEQLQLAEEVVEQSRDRLKVGATGNALWYCGVTFLNRGERERAEDLWREVAELDARTRAPLHGFWVRDIWLATLAGELETAVALGPRLLAQVEERGLEIAGLGLVTSAMCRALLYLGRADEVLAAPPEAGLQAGAEGPGRAEIAPLCLAQLGRHAEAEASLSGFLTQIATGPMMNDVPIFALTTWLETAVLIQDRQAAALLARRLAPVAALATITTAIVPTCIARHLGAAMALQGDRAAALAYTEQALELAGRMRHRPEIALAHLQLAELLLTAGNQQHVTEVGNSVGARFIAPVPSGAHRTEALVHLDVAIAELEQMKMQPALARARALERSIHGMPSVDPVAVYPDGLTAREVEVLRLLAAGMSNREIAVTLVISINTVFQHVRGILTKTGTANRTMAAAYARRHELVE
jgi:DNA-binding NarL/FixJ family response regulator